MCNYKEEPITDEVKNYRNKILAFSLLRDTYFGDIMYEYRTIEQFIKCGLITQEEIELICNGKDYDDYQIRVLITAYCEDIPLETIHEVADPELSWEYLNEIFYLLAFDCPLAYIKKLLATKCSLHHFAVITDSADNRTFWCKVNGEKFLDMMIYYLNLGMPLKLFEQAYHEVFDGLSDVEKYKDDISVMKCIGFAYSDFYSCAGSISFNDPYLYDPDLDEDEYWDRYFERESFYSTYPTNLCKKYTGCSGFTPIEDEIEQENIDYLKALGEKGIPNYKVDFDLEEWIASDTEDEEAMYGKGGRLCVKLKK